MFLAIASLGVIGVGPFVCLRIIEEQWLVALVDAAVVVMSAIAMIYVWITGKVRLPSIGLTLFFLCALIAVSYAQGPDMIYWAFPGMTAAFFLLRPKEAALASSMVLLALLPVLFTNLPLVETIGIIVTLTLNILFSYIFTRGVHGKETELTKQATRDPLTGAGNRGLFDENVKQLVELHHRNGQPCSLIMIDIDHFKDVNDTYGHTRGDEVLIRLVSRLNERLRKSDALYRIGGEEFAILLKDEQLDTATRLAETLRHHVEDPALLDRMTITISPGVAELTDNSDGRSWVQRADQALYQAKNSGRNKVCLIADAGHARQLINRAPPRREYFP